MVQPSQRERLRRVDALEGKSICLAFRFVVRVVYGFRTLGRNHREVVELRGLRLAWVDYLDGLEPSAENGQKALKLGGPHNWQQGAIDLQSSLRSKPLRS